MYFFFRGWAFFAAAGFLATFFLVAAAVAGAGFGFAGAFPFGGAATGLPLPAAAALAAAPAARAAFLAAAAASFFWRARSSASRSIWASFPVSSVSVRIVACGSRFPTASCRSAGTRRRNSAASRVSLALER